MPVQISVVANRFLKKRRHLAGAIVPTIATASKYPTAVGSSAMHRHALASASLAAFAFATPAMANEDVLQQSAKPEQWVLQTGNYSNQRYSKLAQINRDNVKNLKVAWTFSTGVLRGHEGSPLVVGN